MTNIIILVHGTWGRAEDAWYQPSNEPESFTQRLKKALISQGFEKEPILFPFEWEHGNKHSERLSGAEMLADELIQLRSKYPNSKFHFIAHSHGGNVVSKAIEIYIGKLKQLAEEPFRPETFTEQWKVLLEQYNLQDKEQLLNGGVKDVIAEQIDKVTQAVNKRPLPPARWDFIRHFLWYGIHYEIKMARLNEILFHLFTDEKHHRLANIVTLGTPFYYKEWRISRVSHFFDYIANYLTDLMFVAFIWIVPLALFIGIFQPISLPLAIFLILIFFLSVYFCRIWLLDRLLRTHDTNIYFDISKIHIRFLNALGNRKLCRALIIHANYLDEAYLGLSAFPLIDPLIKKYLNKLGKIKLWNFQLYDHSLISGTTKISIPGNLRSKGVNLINRGVAIIKVLVYPLLLPLNLTLNYFINQKISKNTKMFSLGLPEDELSENLIKVKNTPNLECFNTYQFNASENFKKLTINTKQEIDRYFYLRDDNELQKRFNKSFLAEKINGNHTKDQQKHILSLEERGKEFFGLTGFRHSMYYENEKVIDVISAFLIGEIAPEVYPIKNDFEK